MSKPQLICQTYVLTHCERPRAAKSSQKTTGMRKGQPQSDSVVEDRPQGTRRGRVTFQKKESPDWTTELLSSPRKRYA